jgi:hypothetical protein
VLVQAVAGADRDVGTGERLDLDGEAAAGGGGEAQRRALDEARAGDEDVLAETGTPISPDGGYAFNGLTRNTGVQVDPSGNVWLTNNWKNMPNPLGNPGGYSIVAYVGIAPPVKTPLIGTPTRPCWGSRRARPPELAAPG